MRFLKILAMLVGLASPVAANSYYSLYQSTATGTANMNLSGTECLAVSSQTPTTCFIGLSAVSNGLSTGGSLNYADSVVLSTFSGLSLGAGTTFYHPDSAVGASGLKFLINSGNHIIDWDPVTYGGPAPQGSTLIMSLFGDVQLGDIYAINAASTTNSGQTIGGRTRGEGYPYECENIISNLHQAGTDADGGASVYVCGDDGVEQGAGSVTITAYSSAPASAYGANAIIFDARTGVNTAGQIGYFNTTGFNIGTGKPVNGLDVSTGASIGYLSIPPGAPTNGLTVSGKVGIGTSSPVTTLEVNGTGGFDTPISSTAYSSSNLTATWTNTALGPCIAGSTITLTMPITGNVLAGFTGAVSQATSGDTIGGTILMDGHFQNGASSGAGHIFATASANNGGIPFSFSMPILGVTAGTHNFCLTMFVGASTGAMSNGAYDYDWVTRMP